MNTNFFIRAAAALAVVGLSSVCLAGGRAGGGPVFRGAGFHGGAHAAALSGAHGWGGFRSPRGGPPLAGVVRGRTAGIYFTRYGHANTGFAFGHTNAAPANGFRRRVFGRGFAEDRRFFRVGPGFRRDRRLASYAFAPRGRYRYRYGYGSVLPGYIGAGGYYGGDLGSGPSYSAVPGYGYAEPPLAGAYAEAPLGPSPYFGQDGGYPGDGNADYAPSAGGYGGGPQVIVLHADKALRRVEECPCGRGYAETPVVYRFGVGSYY